MFSFNGVNIMKTGTGFMSGIHYKQTHTGLYTIFFSNLPYTYKKDAFTGLLFHIYSICSNWFIVNDEFTKLQKMIAVICYPTYLLDNCLNLFLPNINNPRNKTNVKQKQAMLYLFMIILCLNMVIIHIEL